MMHNSTSQKRSPRKNEAIPDKFEIALFGASAAYALFLHRFKDHWEPDGTILEVMGGVALVMGMTGWKARARKPRNWHTFEGWVWRAFVVAAIPIAIWQAGLWIMRMTQVRRYRRGRG